MRFALTLAAVLTAGPLLALENQSNNDSAKDMANTSPQTHESLSNLVEPGWANEIPSAGTSVLHRWLDASGLAEILNNIGGLLELQHSLEETYPDRASEIKSLVTALRSDLDLVTEAERRLTPDLPENPAELLLGWYAQHDPGSALAAFERELLQEQKTADSVLQISYARMQAVRSLVEIMPHARWRQILEFEQGLSHELIAAVIAGGEVAPRDSSRSIIDSYLDLLVERQHASILWTTGSALQPVDDQLVSDYLQYRSRQDMLRWGDTVERAMIDLTRDAMGQAAVRLAAALDAWGTPYAHLSMPEFVDEVLSHIAREQPISAFQQRRVLIALRDNPNDIPILRLRVLMEEFFTAFPEPGVFANPTNEQGALLARRVRNHLDALLAAAPDDQDGLLLSAHHALQEGDHVRARLDLATAEALGFSTDVRWLTVAAVLDYVGGDYLSAFDHYSQAMTAVGTTFGPRSTLFHWAFNLATKRLRDFDKSTAVLESWQQNLPDDPILVPSQILNVLSQEEDPDRAMRMIQAQEGWNSSPILLTQQLMVFLLRAVQDTERQEHWLAEAGGVSSDWVSLLPTIGSLRHPLPIFSLLLETGKIGPDDLPKGGSHPMNMAAGAGDVELVRGYLELGVPADIDSCCGTALTMALYCGSLETAAVLLKAGADPYVAFPSTSIFEQKLARRPADFRQAAAEMLGQWGWESQVD